MIKKLTSLLKRYVSFLFPSFKFPCISHKYKLLLLLSIYFQRFFLYIKPQMNIAPNFSHFTQNMPYYILCYTYIFSVLWIFFISEHRKPPHYFLQQPQIPLHDISQLYLISLLFIDIWVGFKF